jgi:1-acyl-sn-glycerol-3-phosphate acyltransferase
MWLSYLLIGSVRALLGATPRWLGCDPEPAQRIYFANHTSHIDTVALWSALPPDLRAKTGPVAAADLGLQRAEALYRAERAQRRPH